MTLTDLIDDYLMSSEQYFNSIQDDYKFISIYKNYM